MVYGGYGYLEWDAFWNNGWLLEAQNKEHFGQGGFRGDSRYLSLGADFEFDVIEDKEFSFRAKISDIGNACRLQIRLCGAGD